MSKIKVRVIVEGNVETKTLQRLQHEQGLALSRERNERSAPRARKARKVELDLADLEAEQFDVELQVVA